MKKKTTQDIFAACVQLGKYHADTNPNRVLDTDDIDALVQMATDHTMANLETNWEEEDIDWMDSLAIHYNSRRPSSWNKIAMFENDNTAAQPVKAPQTNITLGYNDVLPVNWDNVEIQPVCQDGDTCSVCDEGDADFYSVYLHDTEGGALCIADCQTVKHAIELHNLIVSIIPTYVDNGHLKKI